MDQRIQRVAVTTAAGAALFAGGWIEGVPRIQRDLGNKTVEVANELGIGGISARFSGQDATIVCRQPRTTMELAALAREVDSIKGVQRIDFDDGCHGGATLPGEPSSTVSPTSTTRSVTTTSGSVASPSVGPTVGSGVPATSTNGSSSSVPVSPTVKPSTGTPSSTSPAERGTLELAYLDGRLTLVGTVPSDDQRSVLVAAARNAVIPANVIDQLVVDTQQDVPSSAIEGLASLADDVPATLSTATIGWDGVSLYVTGNFLDDESRAAFEAEAAKVNAAVILTARPDGDDCDVDDVAARLNAAVREQPIEFDADASTIRSESSATLDRVAALAKHCTGVLVTIVGHTSSDGSASVNLTLSVARANSVLLAMVERNVPEDFLEAVGLGSSQPVLDADGVEDIQRSRRVEFAVKVIER